MSQNTLKPHSRLAQITNKCSDSDLDYFVRESSDILGIAASLPAAVASDPKRVLEYVLTHVVEFKKLNQEDAGPIGLAGAQDYNEL